jgi:hypothetical protein
MARLYWLMLSLVLPVVACVTVASAEPATPSPAPVAWELSFTHGKPTRIVVSLPGASTPRAYWYVAYCVTNNSGKEQMFLPYFQLVSSSGTLTRADNQLSPGVVDAIKKQEGNRFIQSTIFSSGEIRLGETEAHYGVAVWPEPEGRMGRFSVLVGGLSGEFKKVAGPENTEVILRKTLELTYTIPGDEVYRGEDSVKAGGSQWIMH